ncbi:LysR family transcriptional regulator [Ruania alkalisoli]|uniref:LysR family transcriptional regulator n=2 Tax=Ruania alkalisoli TaxID=2779775 RepID=A0A7M1T001_9MICO|nr:LysR family transcriptional regulator [Ruania alkalisoli]
MTLEQVRAFVAVAEELHFGRAAQRLQMTQPPLSRQIQKLERTVGAELLLRSHRGVELTAAGTALLAQARQILALSESAPDLARRAARGQAGVIRLGFTATAAIGVLGDVLRDLDDHLPEVEVVLHEWVSARQLDHLRDGRLDLALTRTLPTGEEFSSRAIHRERLVLALPSEDPLSSADDVTPSALEGRTVIGYSATDAAYFDELSSAVLAGVSTHRHERLTQVHSMLALVAARRGVAIVPRSATRMHPDGVTFREIAGWREPVVRLHAVWRSSTSNPALRRALNGLPSLAATVGAP